MYAAVSRQRVRLVRLPPPPTNCFLSPPFLAPHHYHVVVPHFSGAPEPQLVHYNPKDFDFGKEKAFPLRDQHFFTSIDKAQAELGWSPKFGLVDGLKDSYDKDMGAGLKPRKAADFSKDDVILEKAGVKVKAMA